MKKSGKIIIGIIITIVVVILFVIIRAVLGIIGYVNPVERYYRKLKTDAFLEKKYPEHDFDDNVEQFFSDFGFGTKVTATDENGLEFSVVGLDDSMEDYYHEEWNQQNYGKKIVEYQNGLRDEYFPQIPYVDTYEYYPYDTYHFFTGPFKEEFFESMDDAIEGSKYCSFDTKVTFMDIDLDTADDEELVRFADSIADSLIWLNAKTGYNDIRINSFYYRPADENGAGFKAKEELADSIIRSIKLDRKIKEKNKKKSQGGNL